MTVTVACCDTGMEARTRHALSRSAQHSSLCQRHSDWRCHRTSVTHR